MDEITRGGGAFKQAWAALPKDRKKAISKAVQAGREVPEETAMAIGYAARQIRYSWAAYVGVIALAAIVNAAQGEEFSKLWRAWWIPAIIVAIGFYSYWRLFQSRARNEDLLDSRVSSADGEETDISRLEAEGGAATEVPVVSPDSEPVPPQTAVSASDPSPAGEPEDDRTEQ